MFARAPRVRCTATVCRARLTPRLPLHRQPAVLALSETSHVWRTPTEYRHIDYKPTGLCALHASQLKPTVVQEPSENRAPESSAELQRRRKARDKVMPSVTPLSVVPMAVAQGRNFLLFLHAQAQALLFTNLGVPYRRKERTVAGASFEELSEEQKQAGFVFDALDSDGDHRITREEYNAGFDASSPGKSLIAKKCFLSLTKMAMDSCLGRSTKQALT